MRISRREFLAATGAATATGMLQAANTQQKLTSFDSHIKALLGQMTLEEKAGQMAQPDISFLQSPEDLAKYSIGSVLSGGDSDPASGNDLLAWTDLYDGIQAAAIKSRLKVPLLYGVDAVHGHNNVLGAVVFPHNIALGCTRSADLVARAARVTSEEVRATGIQWAFAPCVAVPQDIRWGRTYEGYSEDPDVVKELGAAAVKGLQRDSLDQPLAVLACAKHFIGDGGTAWGTGNFHREDGKKYLDQGDMQVDEATLRRIHLPGYIAAVNAGVGSIMPSYSSWNGVKCSANKKLLTDLLKRELGFQGFLISDYAALNQIPAADYKQQVAISINAGMDMVMIPDKYMEFINAVIESAKDGSIPMARIDDAVTRILRVKYAMGMMDSRRSQMADRRLHRMFGSGEHRAVARECVRASMVLLKNEGGVLPISQSAKIHVAGRHADNIGLQCGGWTITWQGNPGPVTHGTTILQALRVAAGPQVTYSGATFLQNKPNAAPGEIGIAVIGEQPYAEGRGDRNDLRLSAQDVQLVNDLKRAGLKVVVVVISGRPVYLDDILDKADAIVAAWLPGTEGDGVADVLFGSYKPTGKLSFTWPKATSSSLHRGDSGYEKLFEFGYGLSY
jgi:beta-glucosidase